MPTLCTRSSILSSVHPQFSTAAAPNYNLPQQQLSILASPAWSSRSLSAGCLPEADLMNQYSHPRAELKHSLNHSKLELSHKDRMFSDSTTSCVSSAEAHAAYNMVKKSLSLVNNQDAMADLFSSSSSEMRRKPEPTIEGAASGYATSDSDSVDSCRSCCCSIIGECCSCSSTISSPSAFTSSPSSSSSASEDDSIKIMDAADDGSVASRLLSAIGKSISSPSLGSCKEIVRETPYQKILRLRRMKLHHCTEELGSESCDYTISSLSASPPSSSSPSSLSSSASNGIDQDSAPMSSPVNSDQYYGHAQHQYFHYSNTCRHQLAPPVTHRKADFPPPLSPTSNSGSSFSLTLRPYRQDGRFVLREEKVPCIQHNQFRAARSGGRLTLFLVNPLPSPSDSVTSQSVNTGDVEETLQEREKVPHLNSRKEDEVLESATQLTDDVQFIGKFSALDKDEIAELAGVGQKQPEQLEELEGTLTSPLHIEGELTQEDILLEEEIQEEEEILQDLNFDHAGHDHNIDDHHSTNCSRIRCDSAYQNPDQVPQADELQIVASHEQGDEADELWGGVASDSAARSTLDTNSLHNAGPNYGHTDHIFASFPTGQKKHLQPYPISSSCNFKTGYCRSHQDVIINLSQSYTEKPSSCYDSRWSSMLDSTNCSTGPTSNHSNNMWLKKAIASEDSHKPATNHAAIAEIVQSEGARSLPAASFDALDATELMASQPGFNIGNCDWLQSLHCKGLDYRNDISTGFYMKIHCVATRS